MICMDKITYDYKETLENITQVQMATVGTFREPDMTALKYELPFASEQSVNYRIHFCKLGFFTTSPAQDWVRCFGRMQCLFRPVMPTHLHLGKFI